MLEKCPEIGYSQSCFRIYVSGNINNSQGAAFDYHIYYIRVSIGDGIMRADAGLPGVMTPSQMVCVYMLYIR